MAHDHSHPHAHAHAHDHDHAHAAGRSEGKLLFAFVLTLLMLLVYYGYIGLIAFDKELLARPLGSGVTTLGIPIGIGVIVFTVLITGFYVRRANSEYDRLTAEILKDVNP